MIERSATGVLEDATPLVSVLVPSYNHRKYIIDCLESIANLDYPRLELVVSDDCSRDDTFQLAEQWAEKHPRRFERVSIVRQQSNLGIAKNFCFLLEQARGTYVACIASDDTFMASAIKSRVKIFEQFPEVDGVFGNAQVISDDGSLLSVRACSRSIARQLSMKRLMVSTLLLHWGEMPGPVLMLRRTATMRDGSLGVLPGDLLAEDKYIFLRLAAQGRLRFIDAPVANYRLAPGSLCRPHTANHFNNRANLQCDELIRPMLSGFDRWTIENRIARTLLEINRSNVGLYGLRLFLLRCSTFVLRGTLRVCSLFANGRPADRSLEDLQHATNEKVSIP